MAGPNVGFKVEINTPKIATATVPPWGHQGKAGGEGERIIALPTKPWIARKIIIDGRSHRRAAEQAGQQKSAKLRPTNTHRVESAWAVQADSGIMTISAIR